MPLAPITLEPFLGVSRFEGAPMARLINRILLLDSTETSVEPGGSWLCSGWIEFFPRCFDPRCVAFAD
jgi:hypothetical protein